MWTNHGSDIGGLLTGRKIASVAFDKAKDELTILFDGGGGLVVGSEGYCCSTSWIELVEFPDDIAGAVITAVEDSAPVREPTAEELAAAEVLQVYQTYIRTTKGVISIEYRNDSNGCYGGNLVARAVR